MISDICLNIYLFTLIKEIDASYTNKKSVCASERLFKGNISSQYTNSCFFLCFCSVHPILYRSTSLSYYLIIMFFFFVRAACANIVSSAINYFKVAIELYILTTNRSVGQRVAMAFDVAKHYLPY